TTALDPIGDLAQLSAGDAGMSELADYFYALVARHRASPEPDLTSDWIAARDAGNDITEEELVANLMLLLVAATEAAQDLYSNMVGLALGHPEHGAVFRDDPGAGPGFVDETLRFDPAVQALNRVAARDLVYFGTRIPEGMPLTLLIAAANRDPL